MQPGKSAVQSRGFPEFSLEIPHLDDGVHHADLSNGERLAGTVVFDTQGFGDNTYPVLL